MILEMSVIGVVLPLPQRLHRHRVRLLQEPAGSLTRNLTSVEWTLSLLHAVPHLLYTDPQFSLRLTKDQAVQPQEIRMRAGNPTVHHAHQEQGILRRLL